MNVPLSSREILKFAVKREEEAIAFYTHLARDVEDARVREFLEQLRREEEGHKAKLLRLQRQGFSIRTDPDDKAGKPPVNFSDYLLEVDPKRTLSYRQAVTVAMKRETKSFKLYLDLARLASSKRARELFEALAKEEAVHKLRFETEYFDTFLE